MNEQNPHPSFLKLLMLCPVCVDVTDEGVFGMLPGRAEVAWGWIKPLIGPPPQTQDCQGRVVVDNTLRSMKVAGASGSRKTNEATGRVCF